MFECGLSVTLYLGRAGKLVEHWSPHALEATALTFINSPRPVTLTLRRHGVPTQVMVLETPKPATVPMPPPLVPPCNGGDLACRDMAGFGEPVRPYNVAYCSQ